MIYDTVATDINIGISVKKNQVHMHDIGCLKTKSDAK